MIEGGLGSMTNTERLIAQKLPVIAEKVSELHYDLTGGLKLTYDLDQSRWMLDGTHAS
jgi:hypothetical protein